MIDNKKIEDAKEEIYEDRFLFNGGEIVFNNDKKEEMFYKEDIKEAIGLGVKWTINEFLKDLWHPVSEEPGKGTTCLIQMKLINSHGSLEYTTAIYIGEGKWTNIYISDDADMKIIRWLYINDLLLKK